MDGVLRGVQAMVPANMILVLAWTIAGVTRDLLQTPVFISSIVHRVKTTNKTTEANTMFASVVYILHTIQGIFYPKLKHNQRLFHI